VSAPLRRDGVTSGRVRREVVGVLLLSVLGEVDRLAAEVGRLNAELVLADAAARTPATRAAEHALARRTARFPTGSRAGAADRDGDRFLDHATLGARAGLRGVGTAPTTTHAPTAAGEVAHARSRGVAVTAVRVGGELRLPVQWSRGVARRRAEPSRPDAPEDLAARLAELRPGGERR